MTILAPAIWISVTVIALYAIVGSILPNISRILHALGGSDHTETRT